MAGLVTSFVSARLIKRAKFLVLIFLGLIIFFTNLYFLKIWPKTKEIPTINWEDIEKQETTIRSSASNLKTTPTIPPEKTSSSSSSSSSLSHSSPRVGDSAGNQLTPSISARSPEKTLANNLTFKSSSCAYRMKEIQDGILLFRNITIRSKLGRARALETRLEHPRENDEFFTLLRGFFTVYCDGDVSQAKEKLHAAERYYALTTWIVALEVANPSRHLLLGTNQSFQAGHYLAIQRVEFANVYWTVIDLLDIFITTQLLGIEPEKLNIILMDAHPASQLDPFWSVLFQRLIKANNDRIFAESNDVEFENLVWRYPRAKSPLLDRNLQSLKYIQPFRSFVLKRFGIPSGTRLRNCSQHNLNVLVSFRRDYKSHPRNLDGTIDRKIANEKDVVNEMESYFPKANITTAQLDLLPLKTQLELVAQADVFFGMHGAAHVFPIFMSPGGAVIEMFNFNSGNWHMGKIATLSGHSHITWTNNNWKLVNRNTKSTTIPAGVPSMLIRKAIEKICAQRK
ncbi:hypothetical protein OS493_011238 [Desmophyllum pertusum]|uniref:Glycosyltransferase 61 catalytic domain-containing protein n=1 Tax=Desmophyllum pertusum TaxID=174260 RepID=A0A9W9Z292_9CNID|nr:hypothetical protein OS493_011238 [Desmophyllum pertusum]